MYAVKNISTGTSRVFNVDRLDPYRQRQQEQFLVTSDALPYEHEVDNDFRVESELRVHSDSDVYGENLFENETDPISK